MIDDSVTSDDNARVKWLCVLLNWAVNPMPNDSGHAPSTWVLGRGLRLPYNILSQNAQQSLQTAATSDPHIMDRMRMLNIAQQSIIAARYDRSISSAFLQRSRSTATDPIQATCNLATKSSTGAGTASSTNPAGPCAGMDPPS